MSQANMASKAISRRYARALLDISKKDGSVDQIAAAAAQLGRLLLDVPEFRRTVESPAIAGQKQIAAIEIIMEQLEVPTLLKNFIKCVAANRRLALLGSMLTAFDEELARGRGEQTARIVSAHELSEAQRQSLTQELGKRSGKIIKLQTETDPALIGGLSVQIGSQLIDTSIKTKLDRLHREMREAG